MCAWNRSKAVTLQDHGIAFRLEQVVVAFDSVERAAAP